MSFELDRTGRRILGVLVEKEFTTPDRYPMTVNALQSGCNQKNNRAPEMVLSDFEIEGALNQLFLGGWTTNVRDQGRQLKWKHRLREKLHIADREMLVLAELFLRGPQAPGELRTRTQRMGPMPSLEALMESLDLLGRSKPPLVLRLERRPGERADRYAQTLASDADYEVPDREVATVTSSGTSTEVRRSATSTAIEDRLEELEERVADLESRLRDLESDRTG